MPKPRVDFQVEPKFLCRMHRVLKSVRPRQSKSAYAREALEKQIERDEKRLSRRRRKGAAVHCVPPRADPPS